MDVQAQQQVTEAVTRHLVWPTIGIGVALAIVSGLVWLAVETLFPGRRGRRRRRG